MNKQLLSKLAIGAVLLALVSPSAFAGQTGADPEPGGGVVSVILSYLGLA
jgi:hypothetical protein